MSNFSYNVTLTPANAATFGRTHVAIAEPKSFPNGNSIVGPTVLDYAKRYQTLMNQTAASILALTETVYEAKKTLTNDEFEQFKSEVGLKSKATVSKFLTIGEKSVRLKAYTNRLPHSWTLLYRLVTLSDDEFLAVASFINPEMTNTTLNNVLNIQRQSTVKSIPDIELYLNKLQPGQKKGFLKKLTHLLTVYQVEFKASSDFTRELKHIQSTTAAPILKLPKNHQYPADEDIAA
jgi:hypothetical protein